MARNDFAAAFLKGLYEGGVGNPAVNEQRRSNDLAQQYTQSELNQTAANKGLVPDTSQDFSHPQHPIWDQIRSAMFPGSTGQTLQTAFKPDPNAMTGYTLPTGETAFGKRSDVPPNAMKIDKDKAATMMGEQFRQGQKSKGTVDFDTARSMAELSGNKGALDNLISVKQSQGADSLTKEEMANVFKGFSVKANAAKGGYYDAKGAQLSLGELPSTMAPSTAPGAAYQVKVAARQGQEIFSKPGISQRMNLAGPDLARAVIRNAPTQDVLAASNISDNLKTRLSGFIQKITSKPETIDTPEIRKEGYDLFTDLDKSASPWISNHMASRKEKGFKDSPEEMARQMGTNLPPITFDAGQGTRSVATPFADPDKEARYQAWKKANGK